MTWTLATPLALGALGSIALVFVLRRRGGLAAFVVPHAAQWQRRAASRNRAWPAFAGYAALGLLALALARPQWLSDEPPEKRPGYDLILAVDLSTSMYAEDFQRDGRTLNRLQTIKPIIEAFINRRPDDRIGVVVFAGRAYTFAPLTFDHEWLRRQTGRLAIGVVEDGTAMGDAIGVALARLQQGARHQEARRLGAFIVLLTDGASNRGALDPRAAAGLAAEQGVPIYAIGAGANGVVPMPVFDHAGTRVGTELRHEEIDDLLLRDIAERTGGLAFRATDARALEAAFGAIDAATRTEVVVPPRRVVHESFPLLLAAGAAALALALFGASRVGAREVWP